MPRMTEEMLEIIRKKATNEEHVKTTIALMQNESLMDLADAVKELTEAVKNDKRVYNCDVHLNE